MTTSDIDRLINSCNLLQMRTTAEPGYMHSSARCFDACMRVFDSKIPAESITFRIFLNAPVLKPGEATIYRDGHMEMRTV